GQERARSNRHNFWMARLGTPEKGQQNALRVVHRPGSLRYGRVRVGDALPGARRPDSLSDALLGVGFVRLRGASGVGRVQDEPAAQGEGAGAPLYPALHRLSANRDARPEHVSLLRSLL
ncbi:MAG: hypothetical protein AVDCRST_MAG37-2031, partial [uncultured Rubrobacteraceae bacterium]